MKKPLFNLSILLLTLAVCHAQEKSWQWARVFSDSINTGQIKQLHAAGDNYIISGSFSSQFFKLDSFTLVNQGSTDAFVAGMNVLQEITWALSIGGPRSEDVITTTDQSGNIYLSGSFNSLQLDWQGYSMTNGGADDIFLAKISHQGQVEWLRHVGTNRNESAIEPVIDKFGNIFWVHTARDGGTVKEVVIEKINRSGTLIWQRILEVDLSINSAYYHSVSDELLLSGQCYGRKVLDDGTVIDSLNYLTGFMLALNSDGSTKDVYVDPDLWDLSSAVGWNGDIYLVGSYDEYNEITAEQARIPHLVKLSSNWNREWIKILNECLYENDFFWSSSLGTLIISNEGHLYYSGTLLESKFCIDDFSIDNTPAADPEYISYSARFYILQLGLDGAPLSLEGYGTQLMNEGYVLSQGNNGEMLVVGGFQSDTLRLGDFELINPNPIDTFSWIHWDFIFKQGYPFVAAFKNGTATNASIKATIPLLLYPNPSQDYFYLRSEAFTENPVQIQIFSTDGKLLSQQNLLPNGNRLRVETAALPQGLYIVNVVLSGQIAVQRFVKY